MLRDRVRPGLGIIEPYLPSPAKAPPNGPAGYTKSSNDGTITAPAARRQGSTNEARTARPIFEITSKRRNPTFPAALPLVILMDEVA
jgi:hypothetical protein